jgi:hypothetical protein
MRLSIFDATRARAMQSRVYLDGVDVTNDCQVADDVDGWVVLVVRDGDGRVVRDGDGHPARVERHGRVDIVPKLIV